jgi:hypothetical protein
MPGAIKAAAHRYAFILFAHLDDLEIGIAKDRLEQPLARRAVRQSDDKTYAGPLDLLNDSFGFQLAFNQLISPRSMLCRYSMPQEAGFDKRLSRLIYPGRPTYILA